MKLRRILILVLAILILFTFSCSKEEKTVKEVKLAIGYIPHVQFTPLYVGIEKGYFKNLGIDLKIEYGFGMDISNLLQTNKIDIGLFDSDQLIQAKSNDIPLKAFYQYYQDSPVSIIAMKEKIKSPYDLLNKKIGTPEFFGSSYIGLLVFLNQKDLLNKVNIERIGYTQIQSLTKGDVSAAVCFYNNEPVYFEQEGIDYIQWNVKDITEIVGASFIASDKQLIENKEMYLAFNKAMSKSIKYTINNKDEAFKMALKYLDDLDDNAKKRMRAILDKTCDLFESRKGYGNVDVQKYNNTIQIMYGLGIIENIFEAEAIIFKQ